MGEFKHLVMVKFKEGVAVEEILQGMEKLVSGIPSVKSLEWGEDVVSEETLKLGFTHVFLLTFKNAEDFAAYSSHPSYAEYAVTFSAALDKILLFNFPSVQVKTSSA